MSQQYSLFSRMGRDFPLSIVHELIRELRVSRVMTPEVFTLPSTALMSEVKEIMRTRRISGIPIVDEHRLVGIISVASLICALERGELDQPVSQFMTQNIITCRAQEPVFEALKRLDETGFGRLPVVEEDGSLVGILTKGDVMAGLLHALERLYEEAEQLERSRQPRYFFEALESDETSLVLRYRVRANDFRNGGKASARIKQALLQIGAPPRLSRRVAIATYEAEINLIIHTDDGGHIVAEICPDKITVVAHDAGPGIANIELARQPGYSTASDMAREMGFGAGMGLNNIERCADKMNIWSAVKVGTRVEMIFAVPPEETVSISS